MKHVKTTLFALLLASTASFAQTKAKKAKPQPQQTAAVKIAVPMFNDLYSKYVNALEEGNTGIDYQEFRFSYVYSEQFKVANEKSQEYNRLKKLLNEQIEKRNNVEIIKTARQMLSINYTSLPAQTALFNAYSETGDTKNAAKYKAIQTGLLQSITSKGNGLSCANGWPVIQEEEEYFVLEKVVGTGIVTSNFYRTDGICNEFVTNTDGKSKKYYFETSHLEDGRKILTPVQE